MESYRVCSWLLTTWSTVDQTNQCANRSCCKLLISWTWLHAQIIVLRSPRRFFLLLEYSSTSVV